MTAFITPLQDLSWPGVYQNDEVMVKLKLILVFDIDGAGEFLDAWLLLMEKLTNPKNILDSPYVFGVKSNEPAVFSPLQYLVQIQKVCWTYVLLKWHCNVICVVIFFYVWYGGMETVDNTVEENSSISLIQMH